jgi:hypothetical protein
LVQAEPKAELNIQERKARASGISLMAVEIEDKAYKVKVILLGWLKDIVANLSISTFSSNKFVILFWFYCFLNLSYVSLWPNWSTSQNFIFLAFYSTPRLKTLVSRMMMSAICATRCCIG